LRLTEELRALRRALMLYPLVKRLDEALSEWNLWKDKNVEVLDEQQKRRYWDARIGFDKALASLQGKLNRFVKKYKFVPIIDGDTTDVRKVIVGFYGKRVKGYKTYFPLNKNLLKKVNIPKPPKQLVEVFG